MTNPTPDMSQDPAESSSAEPSSPNTAGSERAEASFEPSGKFAREAASQGHESASGFNDDATDAFAGSQFAIEMAKEWVRQHQTAAMLGAFAIGAFVGALMRD